MKSRLVLLTLISMGSFVTACGGDEATNATHPGSASDATSTTGTGGQPGDAATTGVGGSGGSAPAPERATISGDATWQVTFDDAAKAVGATDCSYTRHYEGVEDRSAPWLCPACEVIFHADVQMTS